MKRYTIRDMQRIARQRGGDCLDDHYNGMHSHLTWTCQHCEHPPWKATPANIFYKGSWCPRCAYENKGGYRRRTIEGMRLLAQSRGGVCLSDTYEGMHTPLLWHCGTSMHPPWRASPANVIYRTSWCPACSGKDANTEADYHALAADLDLAWTGDVLPPSVHHNAHWQCLRCDAPFEAKMNNLRYNPGRGCPNCADFVNGARVSIPQRQLAELLEHRLGAEADVELNRQLDTRSSVVWIDVAVLFDDGRVLAVEYDAWYYHGDRLESDRARDEDVIAAGWPVLRIWSGVMMPTWEQLVPALERLLSGASTREVVILGDWGRGPTMSEAHAPGDPDDSPPCACAEAPAEEAPAEEAPEDEAPGNDTLGGGLPARSRCAA